MKAQFLYDVRIANEKNSIKKMTANHGSIYWEMTPGTAPASADGMFVCEFTAISTTAIYAKVYFTAANTLTLAYADGTNSGSDAYDCTSNLSSGTSYQCRLKYTPTSFTFAIDNTEVCSVSGAVVNFGRDPLVAAYWGTDSAAANAYTSTTFDYPTMDTYKY